MLTVRSLHLPPRTPLTLVRLNDSETERVTMMTRKYFCGIKIITVL